MKKFTLIAMLVLLPMQTQAFFITGNALVNEMHEDEKVEAKTGGNQFQSGHYMGFVAASYDIASELGKICPSSAVTQGQATAIVTKYLKSNPEKWNESATNLVYWALTAAFPCKK